jgi:protein-tyrosine phosphatase
MSQISATPPRPTRILFVCLGNICRSPLAEGVFIHMANQRGLANAFIVDSAGTGGWHEGERPDARSIAVAKRNGVVLPSCARQITQDDLRSFDLLICMDESNRTNVLRLGATPERVKLLLEYAPEFVDRDVPDPYTADEAMFERVFALVTRGCAAMLEALAQPCRDANSPMNDASSRQPSTGNAL